LLRAMGGIKLRQWPPRNWHLLQHKNNGQIAPIVSTNK
jgi:hypothetical protein